MSSVHFPTLQVTSEQMQQIDVSQAPFPELEAVRSQAQSLLNAAQTRQILARTQHLMEGITQLPQTSYTFYRFFQRNGDRSKYETPYFLKRARLSAASMRLFLGQQELKDVVQDYIWNICEEATWVLPAHENCLIDLFSAETGFLLAEVLLLLGDVLDEEVRHRVRTEIEVRIFDLYLRSASLHSWYKGDHNWNGVCNSAVAATFLLLEPERLRIQRALELALAGLEVFLTTAFDEEGSSSEGVAYWNYGLLNFVAFAEILRAKSHAAIDLLATPRLQKIASFPAKVLLSANHCATFSDCDEILHFYPGIITRLLERTGEQTLHSLLMPAPTTPSEDWRLATALRDLLWWDGTWQEKLPLLSDTRLSSGIVRLVAPLEDAPPVIVCVKAGHNDENHNQNDVGSFILTIDGEDLLTDPGRGLYSRDYFGPHRYENIFANSYGHSVPRIDGLLQGTGPAFAGSLLQDETHTLPTAYKHVLIDITRAYPCPDLQLARRSLLLTASHSIWLRDIFQFSAGQHRVEEALLTWQDCHIQEATAVITGEKHTLILTIEQPQEVYFCLEFLQAECNENKKAGVLKRLSFEMGEIKELEVSIKMAWHNNAGSGQF